MNQTHIGPWLINRLNVFANNYNFKKDICKTRNFVLYCITQRENDSTVYSISKTSYWYQLPVLRVLGRFDLKNNKKNAKKSRDEIWEVFDGITFLHWRNENKEIINESLYCTSYTMISEFFSLS